MEKVVALITQYLIVDVTPFNPHPPQNDDVPKKVTDTISYNKVNYNIWWKEISNFIKIAKGLLPNNKNILNWTWVDDSTVYPNRIWSNEMLEDKNLCLFFTDWNLAENELKRIITDNSDLIIDFTKDVDLDNWYKNLQEGKRITVINANRISKEVIDFMMEKNIRTKLYHHENHKKLCYKLFIPFRKYDTIKDETNGMIDDLHTGQIGHQKLFEDLIKNIIL